MTNGITLGNTATEFFENYFETLIMLVNNLTDKEFKKCLKKIFGLLSPECKKSFKEFYKEWNVDTDRKVLNRIYKSVMLYKRKD